MLIFIAAKYVKVASMMDICVFWQPATVLCVDWIVTLWLNKIVLLLLLIKQMPPDIKRKIFANMNVKLYWWSLTFHKVVRQHIWGEMIVLIRTSLWI